MSIAHKDQLGSHYWPSESEMMTSNILLQYLITRTRIIERSFVSNTITIMQGVTHDDDAHAEELLECKSIIEVNIMLSGEVALYRRRSAN
jgi:hypothetical protein